MSDDDLEDMDEYERELSRLQDLVNTALRHTAEHTEMLNLSRRLHEADGNRVDALSAQVDLLCELVFSHLGLPATPAERFAAGVQAAENEWKKRA